MNDAELTDLFRRSDDEERWPDPLPDPAVIWRRARTAELLADALQDSHERSPSARCRRRAALAAAGSLLAAELGVATGLFKHPVELGRSLAALDLPLGTASLLALTAVPMAALLALFWNRRKTS